MSGRRGVFLKTWWSGYLGEVRPFHDNYIYWYNQECVFSGDCVFILTPSQTPTMTATPTITPTNTPTNTLTPTSTPSNTPSETPAVTPTNTQTQTPSVSPTQTNTPSLTASPTQTTTPSETPPITPSNTATQTPSVTPTNTMTPSVTATNTPSITPSVTSTQEPFCPQQLILTQTSPTVLSAYTGTYDRLYSYTGGGFNYAYYQTGASPGWVFDTPDSVGGEYGVVYGRFDGTGYYTILAVSQSIPSNIGIYGITSGLTSYSVNQTAIAPITLLDISLATSGGIIYPIGSGSNNFYIAYPEACPTSTPTPSVTQTATPSVTPTNTQTPSVTPTITPSPTCGTFTQQYMTAELQSCHNFKLSLWNDTSGTIAANAVCDVVVSGCAYGDQGTIFCGTETIASGQHNHNFSLQPVLQPGECVTAFTVNTITEQCPCYEVTQIQVTPTPTPSVTQTATPSVTPTNTETPTNTPSETPTNTPTNTTTQTQTPSSSAIIACPNQLNVTNTNFPLDGSGTYTRITTFNCGNNDFGYGDGFNTVSCGSYSGLNYAVWGLQVGSAYFTILWDTIGFSGSRFTFIRTTGNFYGCAGFSLANRTDITTSTNTTGGISYPSAGTFNGFVISYPSVCPTPTPTRTPSSTPTLTPTNTPSITPSNTATPSITPSVTPSITPSNSATPSVTASITPSVTPTRTPTNTPTPSSTPLCSNCVSSFLLSGNSTFFCAEYKKCGDNTIYSACTTVGQISVDVACPGIDKNSVVMKPFSTAPLPSLSALTFGSDCCPVSPTPTVTQTATPSVTATQTATPSVTPTNTPSITPSNSPTPSITASVTPSVTATQTATPSVTTTNTPSGTPASLLPFSLVINYNYDDGCQNQGCIFGYDTPLDACNSTGITLTIYSTASTITDGVELYFDNTGLSAFWTNDSSYLKWNGYSFRSTGGTAQDVASCSTSVDIFIDNTNSLDIPITGMQINGVNVSYSSGSNFTISAGNNGNFTSTELGTQTVVISYGSHISGQNIVFTDSANNITCKDLNGSSGTFTIPSSVISGGTTIYVTASDGACA